MNRHENETPILRLTDGIWLDTGPVVWSIESLRIYQGQGVALIPDGPDPPIDPSGRLARILASLSTPEQGTVEILDENVNKLSYRDVPLKANSSATAKLSFTYNSHSCVGLKSPHQREEQ